MTDTSILWGEQTRLAVRNFPISGRGMPAAFIQALAAVKAACARANLGNGSLEVDAAKAIAAAADSIAGGAHLDQFPVDVYQTGSGTSSNMNANEVIARLASEALDAPVHANDQVNAGQSSNDVIPTAAHVAAAMETETQLLPALRHLQATIDGRAAGLATVIKTGRTHLMDALPLSLGQELSGWSAQIKQARDRLEDCLPRLRQLAIGATAVGTGLNAPAGFSTAVCHELSAHYQRPFAPTDNHFAALSGMDRLCELSGQLRTLATALMKIANDLRWMNSGPLAGLGEIALPALQPGSSIMPGKVNPVIPEAVCMVAARVMGNDVTVGVAAQSGNFQLNVMWPVVIDAVLESVALLSAASRRLADAAIAGFEVREERLQAALARNPILVTALNPRIGYEAGARIAKRAYAERRPVLEVAIEETGLAEAELRALLDPARLIHPHRD